MEIDFKFLKKYTNTPTPVGYEVKLGGQQVWIDHISDYVDNIEQDCYGSVKATIKSKNNIKETVILDAHCDEIAWTVKEITDNGFIYVNRLGGMDHQIAPSMRVNIWTNDNKNIKGIVGHPAIHIKDRKDKLDITDIFIDTGYSKEELLSKNIEIGNPITYKTKLSKLGDKFICSRALDDKIGGYILIEVAKKLKINNIDLPFNLCFVNSVQEEIGLKGAKMVADSESTIAAICVDVTHDTTPPCYKNMTQTTYNNGCVITDSPSIHKNLLQHIKNTAVENNIKHQIKCTDSGNSTGTNTDSYAYHGTGIPSALISIPLRYMHTSVETVNIDNIKECIELLYYSIINIKDTKISYKQIIK